MKWKLIASLTVIVVAIVVYLAHRNHEQSLGQPTQPTSDQFKL